jgi:hypothetical protein
MTDATTPSAKRPARNVPPKGAPFPKGTSGNPKGRPKGARNLAGLLKEALEERVVDGGQEMSKLQAAAKQIATNAAAGDPRILQMLLAELRRLEPTSAAEEPHDCMDVVRGEMAGAKERVRAKLAKLREECLSEEREAEAKGVCARCGAPLAGKIPEGTIA